MSTRCRVSPMNPLDKNKKNMCLLWGMSHIFELSCFVVCFHAYTNYLFGVVELAFWEAPPLTHHSCNFWSARPQPAAVGLLGIGSEQCAGNVSAGLFETAWSSLHIEGDMVLFLLLSLFKVSPCESKFVEIRLQWFLRDLERKHGLQWFA